MNANPILSHTTDNRTPSSDDLVRAWAFEYATRRARHAARIAADAEFQRWAAEQIEAGPWDMSDCINKAVATLAPVGDIPPFPIAALPWWVLSVESGWSALGGETMLGIYGAYHDAGDVHGRLISSVSVVVDAQRTGKPLGTMYTFGGETSIDLNVDVEGFTIADRQRVTDAATVLASLAAEMQAVADKAA